MCAALARAHDLGVVHRDLKSDNILLTDARRPKGLRQDPRLRPRRTSRATRASRPRARSSERPSTCRPSRRAAKRRARSRDLYALGVLFFEMLTGQLPFRSNDRETLLEMQRTAPPPKPRVDPAGRAPARPRRSSLRLLEKDVRKRYQDAHHLQEELKALQRSLPVAAVGRRGATRERRRAAAAPAAAVAGRHRVGEPRRALLAHGVARLPVGQRAARGAERGSRRAWDLAARANRLEGEVASHTRKLEALERRGRALRAEIGRKVEELAHEESRVLREAAADAARKSRRSRRARAARRAAPRDAPRRRPTAAERQRPDDAAPIFERAGAAAATASRPSASSSQNARQAGRARRTSARDLRRQIEELRAQLARYAEALEEDLAPGREKVAARTREGLDVREGLQRRHRRCSSPTSRASPSAAIS